MAAKEQIQHIDKAGTKKKLPIHAVDTHPRNDSPLEPLIQRARSNPHLLTPKDVLQLQHISGNQAVNNLLTGTKSRTVIQAKLTVGPVGDKYEQEADHVAAQVMRMPILAEQITQRSGKKGKLQAKPLANSITPLAQHAIRENESQIKPISEGAAFAPAANFEDRLAVARGGGKSLNKSVREFMERRMGADFSGVRLHTGGESTRLNRAINAQAFTQGQDIYLGEGRENVESDAGKQLLAHELTHVVQQRQGINTVQRHGNDGVHKHPHDKQISSNGDGCVRVATFEKIGLSGGTGGQRYTKDKASSKFPGYVYHLSAAFSLDSGNQKKINYATFNKFHVTWRMPGAGEAPGDWRVWFKVNKGKVTFDSISPNGISAANQNLMKQEAIPLMANFAKRFNCSMDAPAAVPAAAAPVAPAPVAVVDAPAVAAPVGN